LRLTAAICTWNRSSLLRQALHHLTLAEHPSRAELEVIVVNNNCTDDTDEAIASFAGRLPIRRVFERRPGQSNARNTAVREARGDYVLWTDDDVWVDPRWIAAYADAFERWPDGVVFGGPIVPSFAEPPPAWIERTWSRVSSAFATRDLGPEPLRFDGRRVVPYGANYAVRLAEQRLFPYDPDLGLRPGGSLRGEELALVRQLLGRGHDGWWVPEAAVRHFIPAERMTVGYVRRYFMGDGEFQAMTKPVGGADADGPTPFGRRRGTWRRALSAEVRYRCTRLFSSPEVWVPYLIAASRAWGSMRAVGRRRERAGS
jgi:glycosyltransferase involved in cell wall biosynthesis